jgi:hypothetical protein
MFKKVFLVVFALFILTLVIGLAVWDSTETSVQDAQAQKTSRIVYIEDQSPSLIAFDPAGHMWVYGSDDVLNKNGSLVVYEDGSEIARYDGQDSPVLKWLPAATSHIAFGDDRTVWVGIAGEESGLALFDGESWATFDVSSGLPTNWITALAVDSHGRAWAGFYEHGLGVYDHGEWRFFTSENSGLSVNTIHHIAFDEQDRAWMSTDRGGVNIFDGTDWIVLNTENSGLSHNQVDTILFDDRGQAWIDTWIDISVYGEAEDTWLHYPVEHDLLSSMFFDAAGRLWAQRGLNVHVFDGEEWKYYIDPNFPPNLILPDPQGNILMTNGYDEIRSIAAEDVRLSLQTSTEGNARVFVESGGLFVLALMLILLWSAALLNSWWTMLMTVLIGLPVYMIWVLIFGGTTPAEAAFFSGSYVWNPGVLLTLTILAGGILGRQVKRSNAKGREWRGILIGLAGGIVLSCALIILSFLFMAK